MAEIKFMATDSDIMETFAVMKQLRPHLSADEYAAQIKRMQDLYGYKLLAVVENNRVKSVAGYRLSESLAWGKYLYVDDLITDENSRANGYAALLLDWLEAEAEKCGFDQFHLDSGVHRHDAHRFYLKRKMKISSHHFQRTLKP
ncbi:GNAT family N-acetyltransferase [Paenibacillus alkalitolerans]|uniref:GNAT family N-acetyltransferase n=1 Tax=Paenibacillus alkalitolerans TaxID=2799335 RepID=UPI0018F2C620|nr:GNAT family N-acetyltransferase [Paenibacillus alkalitolerans]